MVFAILPSHTKNEREFYIDGDFIGSKCARMSVYMLSELIFINRNTIGIQPNQTIDIFIDQLRI